MITIIALLFTFFVITVTIIAVISWGMYWDHLTKIIESEEG